MHKSIEVLNTLQEAAKYLNDIHTMVKESCENLGTVDKEITDILHEIEFSEIDEKKSVELVSDLKTLRQSRRVHKEDQDVFMVIRDFYDKNATFAARLTTALESAVRASENRNKRYYVPRIRKDKMDVIPSANTLEEGAFDTTVEHEEPTVQYIN